MKLHADMQHSSKLIHYLTGNPSKELRFGPKICEERERATIQATKLYFLSE